MARQSINGHKVSIVEVANAIQSPLAYTSKILQQLKRFGCICSDKGRRGGFYIKSENLETLKLITVVEAIDGSYGYSNCVLGLAECGEHKPCPLHHQFKKVRNDLRKVLGKTTIKSLALGLEKSNTFLKF